MLVRTKYSSPLDRTAATKVWFKFVSLVPVLVGTKTSVLRYREDQSLRTTPTRSSFNRYIILFR
jgi:hypothetical protein